MNAGISPRAIRSSAAALDDERRPAVRMLWRIVTIRSTTGTVHTLANTNPDTTQIPGLLMSKTGYTDLAGGNLVIIFDAGIDHPVAIVVLGSTRDDRHRP